MPQLLALTQQLTVALDPNHQPHWDTTTTIPSGAVAVGPNKWATLVDDDTLAALAHRIGGDVAHIRALDPDTALDVFAAAAYLRNQQVHRFHPGDGTPLTFDDNGHIAHSAEGNPFFPRLDPAVIGLVLYDQPTHPQHAVLLGRDKARPDYYSLISGYVSPGETLEGAFAREVAEEAGRRVFDITYVTSQPWPVSGALMLGMKATTTDREPTTATDGELLDTVWASKDDILGGTYPLPKPGSLSHTLMTSWAKDTL